MGVFKIIENGKHLHKCDSKTNCKLLATYDIINLESKRTYHACHAHALRVANMNFAVDFLIPFHRKKL